VLRQRLLSEPADHLLLVVPELLLGELMRCEIRESVGVEAEVRLLTEVQQHSSLAIGAVVVVPAYLNEKLTFVGCPPLVAVTYSPADAQLATIRELSCESTIGVISISDFFLRTANGLLGSAVGSKHSFQQFLIQRSAEAGEHFAISRVVSRTQEAGDPDLERLTSADLRGIDLLFCDSVAYCLLQHPHAIRYRLISDSSLAEIQSIAASLQPVGKAAAAP
jgi:hypothetical protein